MNKALDTEGMELTEQSWRSKFYGMIKEGHKNRVPSWMIRLLFVLLAAAACAVELVAGYRATTKTAKLNAFGLPDSIDPNNKLYIPLYDPKSQTATNLSENGKGARFRIVERLQPIKLTGSSQELTGSQVQAELSMGASNGMVIAVTTRGLRVAEEEIFPAGTSLYGRGSSRDDRLFVEFTKAILPDRNSKRIKAQALDVNDQALGLKGKKISDVAFKIAASSGLIFLSGMADGMKQSQTIFDRPTVQDAALNGVATAASRQGEKLLQEMDAEGQRVDVKVKTPILVMFDDLDGKGS